MSDENLLEVTYNVFDEDNHASITVRPFPEAPESAIELCTLSKESTEFWGEFSAAMSPKMARTLAKALVRAADDMDENYA